MDSKEMPSQLRTLKPSPSTKKMSISDFTTKLLSKLTNDVDVVDDHTIQSNLFARTNPFDAIIN